MFHVHVPETEQELEDYYHLRWSLLRAPLQRPRGTEKDIYDEHSEHRMILDNSGRPIACGRIYTAGADESQIHYMAVDPKHRKQGLGSLLISALEDEAYKAGSERIVMNARVEAVPFYEKCGFSLVGSGQISEGVRHRQMIKEVNAMDKILRHPEWCAELQQEWATKIPISQHMGINIRQYSGWRFETAAPLNANVNVHDTMFAGSIYSQATLTGWGLVWLMLKEQGLLGNIVLSKGNIHYKRPINLEPFAVAHKYRMKGSLRELIEGRNAKLDIDVDVYSGPKLAAVFSATFVVMPIGV